MRGLRTALLVSLVVMVGAGSALVARAATDSSGEDVFMEPASAVGPHPFTTQALEPAAAVAPLPPAVAAPAPPAGPTSTALYGGSGSQRKCDPAALIAFLETHADKAAAWVGALNADPTLQWTAEDGTVRRKVAVSEIRAYITRELSATFLIFDTRVTNHGFFNGRATPHQSILQAGTAVLVDHSGVPRARCACGNPLIPPHKVRHPHYRGPCWPGCRQGPQCVRSDCTATTVPSETTTTTTAPPDTTTTQRQQQELPPPPPPIRPPVTHPPATSPPVTHPPATNPPATSPPTTRRPTPPTTEAPPTTRPSRPPTTCSFTSGC
jgi:hypothetical protein